MSCVTLLSLSCCLNDEACLCAGTDRVSVWVTVRARVHRARRVAEREGDDESESVNHIDDALKENIGDPNYASCNAVYLGKSYHLPIASH